MPLHVALTHKTSYRYDRLVALGPQTIRLRPAPQARTAILSYELTVEPKPHFINWMQDPQGNHLARVVFPDKVDRFEVTVDLVADMVTINPFDFFLEPEAETWPFSYDPVLDQELAPFRKTETPGPQLTALLAAIPRVPQQTVDKLVALNTLIQKRVAYIVRLEPGVFSPEETLAGGTGSCRDSAWLLVQVLRHLGMAARFVSGYLIQLVGDVKPLEGPEGPTADFTDLHAWAEVYLPGAGWVGLDATSGLLCGEGHIPLAASPDPISAAPISGLVEKAETTFDFVMRVERIKETPRTTKPYTEAQWQAILARGHDVDRALKRGDVRLTMGGEPTFIAANDMDAPEWNTDALGPTKRKYAGRLIRRLMDRWSSGAVLNHSMGKQYPGEQLPRWALHCHWRADGEPVWTDPALLASDDDTDNATAQDAARFAYSLAERLQVDPALVIPAYEDIHYYLWKEHRLPANVLVEDSKLADKLERARLARVFGQGLASSVGSVLPLRRVIDGGTRRWQSGKWFFKSGEMFLIPGDSPLGLRLPLESLPWVDPEKAEYDQQPDPFAPREKLPTRQALQPRTALGGTGGIENFRPVQQQLPVIGTD
ncbi:MAG TPA: transglutaminase family protein, partial [Rhodopila sp.]|nr:transglutaminase family protein [Rhodopila sp.]